MYLCVFLCNFDLKMSDYNKNHGKKRKALSLIDKLENIRL